jgi:hypothetical protein
MQRDKASLHDIVSSMRLNKLMPSLRKKGKKSS